MALSYAADGEFTLATGIAEKVERLAPWSPRYLQLQVYLDEEGARRQADGLVATAREHLAAGRGREARASAQDALAAMPATHWPTSSSRSCPRRLPPWPPGRPSPPQRRAARHRLHRPAPPPAATAHRPSPPGAAPPRPRPPRPRPPRPPAARARTPVPAAGPSDCRGRGLERRCSPALREGRARRARRAVERALALDPANRRALELQKILRVLG